MTRLLMCGVLLAMLAALALRCPQLATRPMHNDEAVNAIKLRALWEKGSYQYDPQEFHGPTLLYVALSWVKLSAVKDFVHCTEAQLRLVTVFFGTGLILLLLLLADGLGRRATAGAAVLTAVSPAMVFYSRYFIHEMLLVFFTVLALAAGWRYTRSRKWGWALLAGAAIGLMQATKETFVLTLAALAVAFIVNEFWDRSPRAVSAPFHYDFKHLAIALVAWFATALILFSSFFTNTNGPLDAIRTYLPWLQRAGGASPHIHPWDFYLSRLLWFHSGHGPIWSEGLIFALALAGIATAFFSRQRIEGNAGFIRFLAIYTIVLTIIYSVISYKTPWCLLSFWEGMILLAGVGIVRLFSWLRQPALRIVAGVILLAGTGQLGVQAWRASVPYAADIHNPYVYAQTSPDILNLVQKVDAIAQTQKNPLIIKVMAPDSDFWPLPWYLRQFNQTGWWSEMPTNPLADVTIVSTKFNAELDAQKTHLMAGIFQLRPQVFFELYVETNLWHTYVEAPKARSAD